MRTKPRILRDGFNIRQWRLKLASEAIDTVEEQFRLCGSTEEHAEDLKSLREGIDKLWEER